MDEERKKASERSGKERLFNLRLVIKQSRVVWVRLITGKGGIGALCTGFYSYCLLLLVLAIFPGYIAGYNCDYLDLIMSHLCNYC